MSKAAELAALIGSQTALSNRNLVINGAAEVYQRGASATAHNSYSVDRWQIKNTSGATCTHEQSTDAPAPFKNSVKYTAGGTSCTAAQVAGIAQRMEGTSTTSVGLGTSAAQPVTLSFYVKSSVTGTYAVSIRNNDTDLSFVNTYTINSANTWEHKTVTFSAQTAGTWLNTTGIGVRLWFDLGSGDNFNADATGQWRSSANYLTVSNQADVVGTSGATWFVTGVQLELGEQATPFEHRSFGDELKQCERYYEKTYQYSTAPGTAVSYDGNMPIRINGFNNTGNEQKYLVIRLRTEKRASPTTTYYNEAGNTGRCSTYDAGGTADNGINIGLSISGTSMQGFGPSNGTFSGIGCYMTHDAEL
jgi:hypothetical protein